MPGVHSLGFVGATSSDVLDLEAVFLFLELVATLVTAAGGPLDMDLPPARWMTLIPVRVGDASETRISTPVLRTTLRKRILESGPFRRMERRTPEKVYGGWESERVSTDPGSIFPRPLRAKKRDKRSCEVEEGSVRAK